MTTDTSLLDHPDSAIDREQATSGLNRSQFLRNGAKGGIALVAGGRMLGQVTGISFASSA